MVCSRTQLVWVLLAWASVVAQVAPKTLCHACDKPCCAVQARDTAAETPDATGELAGGCALCAAAADRSASEPSGQPCHCHLTARHEQPLCLTRATLPTVSAGSVALGLPAAPPAVPQKLSVSREYVTTLFSALIRPPRILYGVWRD